MTGGEFNVTVSHLSTLSRNCLQPVDSTVDSTVEVNERLFLKLIKAARRNRFGGSDGLNAVPSTGNSLCSNKLGA